MEDTETKVTICGKAECGCAENVRTLLKIYLPIYALMFEGGGCHHKHTSHAECGRETSLIVYIQIKMNRTVTIN